MSPPADREAAYELLHTGALVEFEILDRIVEPSPVEDSFVTRVELVLGELEESDDVEVEAGVEPERTRDVEWGAFGFVFALAVLSFHDARPRGTSEIEYQEHDEFTVADLLRCLKYERGELQFSADYVRGRCMKTDIRVRPDGKVTLDTRGRGSSAVHWVEKLKGEKTLGLVKEGEEGDER